MSEHAYLKWLSKETETIYWCDSAIDELVRASMKDGAVGMTTNPFLVQQTLNADRSFWAEEVAKLPKDLQGDEKAEALVKIVIGYYSKLWMPLYENGNPYDGIVCVQLNPLKSGDAAYMIEQGKLFASIGPNVMLKIPATNAGIKAIEEMAALGIHVTSTVNLTVPQAMAAGAALKRGKERAIANGIKPGLTAVVMQPGRLDDYIRDTAHDSETNTAEEDILQGGIACCKHAYNRFRELGYDALLLLAGFRSLTQITEMAGGKLIVTVPPAIAASLPSDSPKEERIQNAVDEEAVQRLLKLPEFKKAYLEDGMAPTDFITYGAFNRTIDQNINSGWNHLTGYAL